MRGSLLIALVVGLAMTGTLHSQVALGSPPEGTAGVVATVEPATLTVEQVNLCMWGSVETQFCFQNDLAKDDPRWTAAEHRIAGAKRQALVTQVERHKPDVITVNEGCLNDVVKVARAIQYEVRIQTTGGGTDGDPRLCTVDRGPAVNAIFAQRFVGTGPQGYFADQGYRSYLCSQVSSAPDPDAPPASGTEPSVRVCTAHLSLGSQGSSQVAECQILRDQILDLSAGPVIFAGDVNRSDGQDCAPARFQVFADGLQHIYATTDTLRPESPSWSDIVEHTDHDGLLVKLGPAVPDSPQLDPSAPLG